MASLSPSGNSTSSASPTVSDTGSSSFTSSPSSSLVSGSSSPSTTSTSDTSTSDTSSTTSTPDTSSPPTSSSTSTSSPSSTDSTSSTTLPPTSSTTTSTSNVPTSAAPSSTSDTDSSTSTSPSASVLTAPVTTVVRTTVVGTSNGQTFTTVFSTESVAPAGSTITVGSDSTDITNSTSHTGAIVGGVVGGVVALLLLILGALWFIRRRRRLQDEAFDGNFDPDRIVRPASGAGNLGGRGPTLPNIPVTNSDDHIGARSPQMAEIEDDGMGGRLNGSAIGAGVVAPYPLHHPTTSPTRSAASPPPSARSWGNSSDAQHSLYNGHVADWRGPSPGPSIPTQYTGGSGSAAPPSSYSHGMIANLPPGASPGPAGPGTPSSAYAYPGATGTHGRRYSAGTSTSSGDRQPLYAAAATGSASSSTGGGSVQNSGRFAVANPDDGTYAGGFNEDARRAYITGGPSGKSPTGPSQSRPREVLVHEDGGRIENADTTPESEGPEEIPPTYDSLLGAAGMASRSEKQNRS
ncbi:hypothetical protein LENED_000459 [Lentinula edodes]|uniref:Uncharacterized protein n=1 Tax=Lentinula edodes TaxID=5353 RepID=A0A1Q3DVL8_LENED|nr:hypothetical protein LENED_000459 [Lentinula edodes]